MVEDLRAGTINALVAQDPFRIGYEAVKSIARKLAGETPPKNIYLSARVITLSDLDNPEVKTLLFPDLKRYLR
jgi:ribose transport system substrate-binding protein